MAMLAEGKSKNKWVLNPRGNNAINEMQFGRKMMEKMGWQSGDGLGINKQGVTEPLRVRFKNDSKGIGYKKNADNEWLKVEDEFSKILENLSSNGHNPVIETNIESLEKKSEVSKARLHYHKFTRNKDLSRYSEKDLSCILGHTKNVETEADETEEYRKFCDKGSMESYFEKLTQKFVKNSTCEGDKIESSDQDLFPNGDKSEKIKAKKKKKTDRSTNIESSIVSSLTDGNDSEEGRGKSKRRKCDESMLVKDSPDYDDSKTKKKKSKKEKEFQNPVENESLIKMQDVMVTEPLENHQVDVIDNITKSKKSKSSKRKFHEVNGCDELVSDKNVIEDGVPVKPSEEDYSESNRESKRKRKKLKLKNESENLEEKADKNLNEEKAEKNLNEETDQVEAFNNCKKKDQQQKSNETYENRDFMNCSIPNNLCRSEKLKYKKNKSEEINETESILNMQILDKDDNASVRKDGKRKGKNKRKKIVDVSSMAGNNSSGSENNDNLSDGNEETPNDVGKKVRFDLAETERELEENSIVESKHIDDGNRKKSKKSKKQICEMGEKIKNIDEVACQNEIATKGSQNTEANDSVNNLKEGRKEKSKKKIKSEVADQSEELFSEQAAKKFKVDEGESVKQKSKHKCQALDDEAEERTNNVKTKKENVDYNNSSDDGLANKKKKSKKSKVLEKGTEASLKAQFDEEIMPVNSKQVSKKHFIEEKCEENFSSINDSLENHSKSKKSKSKKYKTNQEGDEVVHNQKSIKVDNTGTSLNIDKCNLNSNEIKDGALKKSMDKKAKLLALLEKTTKDDSDLSDSDSDSGPANIPISDSDSGPKSKVSVSCFKGSNFEKIPGYRNPNAS